MKKLILILAMLMLVSGCQNSSQYTLPIITKEEALPNMPSSHPIEFDKEKIDDMLTKYPSSLKNLGICERDLIQIGIPADKAKELIESNFNNEIVDKYLQSIGSDKVSPITLKKKFLPLVKETIQKYSKGEINYGNQTPLNFAKFPEGERYPDIETIDDFSLIGGINLGDYTAKIYLSNSDFFMNISIHSEVKDNQIINSVIGVSFIKNNAMQESMRRLIENYEEWEQIAEVNDFIICNGYNTINIELMDKFFEAYKNRQPSTLTILTNFMLQSVNVIDYFGGDSYTIKTYYSNKTYECTSKGIYNRKSDYIMGEGLVVVRKYNPDIIQKKFEPAERLTAESLTCEEVIKLAEKFNKRFDAYLCTKPYGTAFGARIPDKITPAQGELPNTAYKISGIAEIEDHLYYRVDVYYNEDELFSRTYMISADGTLIYDYSLVDGTLSLIYDQNEEYISYN